MNNKPAPIQVVKTQNYISEYTKTNNGTVNGDASWDTTVETEIVAETESLPPELGLETEIY